MIAFSASLREFDLWDNRRPFQVLTLLDGRSVPLQVAAKRVDASDLDLDVDL